MEATWWIYQHVVAAYRAPTKKNGKTVMNHLITMINKDVPATLVEICKLGRT